MTFSPTPRQLFLVDCLGAWFSALMLGLVLPWMKGMIGLPQEVLQGLAIVAVLMAVYGTCCYRWAGHHWRWLMVGIAFANLFYICLSLGVGVWFYQHLTVLGKVYFALELGIIGVLVYWELRVSGNADTVFNDQA